MKHLMKGKTTLAVALLSTIASVSISSSALAVDLTITDPSPSLFFNDTSTEDGIDWWIWGEEDSFGGYFQIRDLIGTTNAVVLQIDHSANNENSFMVDSSGDINLADGAVFIDRSATRLGVGTSAPLKPLHVSGSSADIRMEATSGATWDINPGGIGLWFNHRAPGEAFGVLQINNDAPEESLTLNSVGVGIGTDSPTHALHISQPTKRMLFLDNTAGSSSIRRLLQMTNKGPVGFEMTDRDNPVTWQFRSGSSGDFLINNQAIPGSELTLAKANGNLTVKGTVTALSFAASSSRTTKTDISSIKTSEVMAKLKQVEVAEWRYKTADKNDRHISPMAEDFYSLFKLGPDNKHINPNDLASVAIIAAKELQKKSETVSEETAALKSDTVALKAENASLKEQLKAQSMQLSAKDDLIQARLASLEKLVMNLASGQNLLSEKGDKVVLK